jgi:hypothetical protein
VVVVRTVQAEPLGAVRTCRESSGVTASLPGVAARLRSWVDRPGLGRTERAVDLTLRGYGDEMRRWLSALGLVCGCTGATLWAVGVTVLQSASEPTDWAENNTYWVRDVRWMAIFAVLGALILVFRGDRSRSGLAALAVGGWLGLDLWLDHIDVAGPTATRWAVLLGCVVVLAAFLAERLSPGEPDHWVLAIGAAVAAATVPAAVLIGSPTDAEAALSRSALVLGWLLTAVAVGCALSAAAEAGIRHGRGAVGVASTAACLVILVRAVSIEDRIIPVLALTSVLFAGVAMVYLPWPGLRRAVTRYGLLCLGAVGAYMAFVFAFFLLASPIAALLTEIAANPPVNGADTDTITALYGLPVGVVLGLFLAEQRERPTFWYPESPPADRRLMSRRGQAATPSSTGTRENDPTSASHSK